jgi:diguanylate cyclase (GGDEF)-like protein/PAS domain S-box-containing protein
MAPNHIASVVKSYSYSDLVDIPAFSRLLECFFKAIGIPNGLVGAHGEIICQAGWVDACALFHRVNLNTNLRCLESNLELMRDLQDGEVVGCQCKNGLVYYATPVVIEGRQLASLFLGQVFNEPPDVAFFQKQAAQFGFDESEYMDAIHAVPIIEKGRLEALMDCMVEMAQMLAASGLVKLRQTTLEHDLYRTTEQHIQLQDILDSSPVGIGWSNVNGKIEYINRRFTQLFGYTLEDLPDVETWCRCAYPDPEYRAQVIDPWYQQVALAKETGLLPPELEASVICKDGAERRVLLHVSWVGNKRLVNFSEMTAHWQSELRNQAHNTMLEMVARGEPLADILNAIVTAIETEEPSSMCSILLMDKAGKHLLTGAAPSLPPFYNEAIHGIEIGMGVGSCGTAASLGERMIVEDIMSHDYWRPYAELAKRAELGACWSEPIISSAGKVLGTFAIYHADPAMPTPENIERINFAANLVAIAIENQNTREELVERERAFRSLAEHAPDNIARYDREGQTIYVNPRLEVTLGMSSGQLLGRPPSEHFDDGRFDILEAKVKQVLETGEDEVYEFEVPGPAGMTFHSVHMVAELDESGTVTGVLALGRDLTERKRMEEELEHQAHSDYLTGLTNRRHFLEQAESELSRLNRCGGALALIMFDIDFFKQINDTHGHDIGDLVLQKIAAISRETMRVIDIIGRIGGEEFVVLLPQTGRQQAAEAAERLRIAIAEGEVRLENGLPVRFSASFGVVTLSDDSGAHDRPLGIDDLLIRADSAMYQAKQTGRNRVCLSSNR